jgi:hypothetical protein
MSQQQVRNEAASVAHLATFLRTDPMTRHGAPAAASGRPILYRARNRRANVAINAASMMSPRTASTVGRAKLSPENVMAPEGSPRP